MKKRQNLRLKLNRETLRDLTAPAMAMAEGGNNSLGCVSVTCQVSCAGSCARCVTQTNCFSICYCPP